MPFTCSKGTIYAQCCRRCTLETKSDFLSLPNELRTLIYNKLPVGDLGLLQLASQQTNQEISDHLSMPYSETTLIALNIISQIQIDLTKNNVSSNYSGDFFYQLEQLVEKNLAFQKFIHDTYNHTAYTIHFGKPPLPELMEDNVIYLTKDKYTKTLQCKTKFSQWGKITEDDFTASVTIQELTADSLTPKIQAEIKHLLGLQNIKDAVDSEDYLKYYMKLFCFPTFISCYLNEQIKFESLSCVLYNKGPDFLYITTQIALIKAHALELGDYQRNSGNIRLLVWLSRHPKAKGLFYSKEELNFLTNKAYFDMIDDGYVTLEECLQHGEKLLEAREIIRKPHREFLPKISTHSLMEFFCQGLSPDPQTFLKGQAILKLFDYIIERNSEEDDSNLGKAFNFFKSIVGVSLEDKVDAAKALMYVLFGEDNKSLSDKEIKILTNTLGLEKEDRLTKIVRIMILEPLNLASLEELNSQPSNVYEYSC